MANLIKPKLTLDADAWDRIWEKHSNHWCPLAPKQEQYIQLIVNTELRRIADATK